MEIRPGKAVELARKGLGVALDKALETAEPVAARHIESTRKNHDGITPAGVLRRLEWEYRLTATTTGAGTGLAAVTPNPVAWAATVSEVGLFIASSAVLVMTDAQIHGLTDLDPLQRRVLVLSILLGHSGSGAIKEAAPNIARQWAKHLVAAVPAAKLKAINNVLSPNFVTKYGSRQGVLVLGREAPVGIGAAIGGAANAAFGEMTIRAARKALGPAENLGLGPRHRRSILRLAMRSSDQPTWSRSNDRMRYAITGRGSTIALMPRACAGRRWTPGPSDAL